PTRTRGRRALAAMGGGAGPGGPPRRCGPPNRPPPRKKKAGAFPPTRWAATHTARVPPPRPGTPGSPGERPAPPPPPRGGRRHRGPSRPALAQWHGGLSREHPGAIMITATRRIQFAAGHRVFGHEGKCRYLHGHNFVALVTAAADDLDAVGRVIDFGVLKE